MVGTGRATPGGSKSEAENDASRSTIGAIVLDDEAATVEDEEARGYSEVEDDNEDSDSAEEMMIRRQKGPNY